VHQQQRGQEDDKVNILKPGCCRHYVAVQLVAHVSRSPVHQSCARGHY